MNLRSRLEPLLAKYDSAVPRYTSYPPIPYWGEVNSREVAGWLEQPCARSDPSLSLYTHIPFCRSRCHYCGCFVIITPHQEPAERYLAAVHREMELVAERLADTNTNATTTTATIATATNATVSQYHLGGGTPNFISPAAMEALVTKARALFPFGENPEMSIEVDPRHLDTEELAHLRNLGFNRISLGVQDFDEQVQAGVNRIEPYGKVAGQVETARKLGFRGINFDLIYGLPHQTRESFARTVERVVTLRPDRLALYNFAYLPQAFPHQKKMDARALPGAEEKLAIFLLTREMLMENGYLPIGLDHFALAGDELAIAYQDGSIRRNFMGYTTQAGSEMLAFGVSAISEYNGRFWQNEKKLARYKRTVEAGNIPAVRGMILDPEDLLRKDLIYGLFCRGNVGFADLAAKFGVDPKAHFSAELENLAPLEADGLLTLDDSGLRVSDVGQFFLRNIAVVFDAHLNTGAQGGAGGSEPLVKFSRTV